MDVVEWEDDTENISLETINSTVSEELEELELVVLVVLLEVVVLKKRKKEKKKEKKSCEWKKEKTKKNS